MVGNHDFRPAFQKVFPEASADAHGFIQATIDIDPHYRLVLLDTLNGPPRRGVEPHAGYLCARRLDRFRIRIQGHSAPFREELLSEGVTLLTDDGQGEWRVAVPAGWTNIAFFKLAAIHEVVIRSLVPDDETLEELFLRTVGA